jgi:hypothetical protein
VASPSYRWAAAGVWARMLPALQPPADRAGAMDWDSHFVDGTTAEGTSTLPRSERGAPRPELAIEREALRRISEVGSSPMAGNS